MWQNPIFSPRRFTRFAHGQRLEAVAGEHSFSDSRPLLLCGYSLPGVIGVLHQRRRPATWKQQTCGSGHLILKFKLQIS